VGSLSKLSDPDVFCETESETDMSNDGTRRVNGAETVAAFEECTLWPSVAPARDPHFMDKLRELINALEGPSGSQLSVGMRWIKDNARLFQALTEGQDRTALFRSVLPNPHILALLYMPQVLDMLPRDEAPALVRDILQHHAPQDLGWVGPIMNSRVTIDWLGEALVDMLYRGPVPSDTEMELIHGYQPITPRARQTPWPYYVQADFNPGFPIWDLLDKTQLARVATYVSLSRLRLLGCVVTTSFGEAIERQLGREVFDQLNLEAAQIHRAGVTLAVAGKLSSKALDDLDHGRPSTAAVKVLKTAFKAAATAGNYPLARLMMQTLLGASRDSYLAIQELVMATGTFLEQLKHPQLAAHLARALLKDLPTYSWVTTGKLEHVEYMNRYGNKSTTSQAVSIGCEIFIDLQEKPWNACPGTLVMFDGDTAKQKPESIARLKVYRVAFNMVPGSIARLVAQ
jgi:hypothetical protein